MTQVQGIPYRRHGPSAALRQFLDPLDPGDYFDCGRARLHGLDDALLEEARSRGRAVGDDDFLLVATDMGLIFCRPSISFAIAARWEDIGLIRPRGDDPVVLPVTWPRHGELKFTISKRLAGNIFRRWLQLRMHVARRARQSGQRPRPLPAGAGLDSGPEGADRLDGEDTGPDLDDGPTSVGLDHGVDVVADAELEAGIGVDPFPELDLEIDLRERRDLADASAADEIDLDRLEGLDTVEPSRPSPAETGDDLLSEPQVARAGDGTLVDAELQRVTVPRSATVPPSWVGSAVSLAASLVVISTVVLIAAVSLSLWRGATDGTTTQTSADVVSVTPTTIDHERFRASSDPVGQLGGAGPEVSELAPSAAGGASQSLPSSSRQLLAAPPDPADPDAALLCSSNYSGCVPDVAGTAGADVDCVGQGDGPYFADHEVMVLGDDVYGLDSDGDRVACEADQLAADPLSADPAGSGTSGD